MGHCRCQPRRNRGARAGGSRATDGQVTANRHQGHQTSEEPARLGPQETRDSVVKNNPTKSALRADRIDAPNRPKQPRESLEAPRLIFLGFFVLYLKISSYKYMLSTLKRLYKHSFKKVVGHIAKDETFKSDGADTGRACHGVTNRPAAEASSRPGKGLPGATRRAPASPRPPLRERHHPYDAAPVKPRGAFLQTRAKTGSVTRPGVRTGVGNWATATCSRDGLPRTFAFQ